MSAVLEFTSPPREVWLVSRDLPVRKKIWLSSDEEESFLNTGRYEIVRGELRERSMPSPQHGRIQAMLAAELLSFVKSNNIGLIYTETNFQLEDGVTRVPDVAFLSFERFSETGETEGRFYLAPDLAVEVVSPSDKLQEVFEKINDYLEAKVKQVWLVLPEQKTLTVYRSRKNLTVFTEHDELVSEDLLPGFRLQLSDIFQKPIR